MNGSTSTGYDSSASSEPRFDSAYRRYGGRPGLRWANHRWISGAVAESRRYGAPTETVRMRRIRRLGAPELVGLSASAGVIGSVTRARVRSTACRIACRRHVSRLTTKCAYAYPPRSINWKNNSAVAHTPGVDPNHGRMYLPMIGWTWKSRNALRNTVAASSADEPPVRALASSAMASPALLTGAWDTGLAARYRKMRSARRLRKQRRVDRPRPNASTGRPIDHVRRWPTRWTPHGVVRMFAGAARAEERYGVILKESIEHRARRGPAAASDPSDASLPSANR